MHQLLLQSLDPSIGRFDFNCISDQQMMELLVADLDKKTLRAMRRNGDFKPIAEWQICKTVGDIESTVIELNIPYHYKGTLALEYIPKSVTVCQIIGDLYGTLETQTLPRSLLFLLIELTNISGAIDLTQLPECLETLILDQSRFTGSLDLGSLPNNLRQLSLLKNSFRGSISLENLPESLIILHLQGNQLIGSIRLDALPSNIAELNLSENQLRGELNFDALPSSLERLSVGGNYFSGEFRLTRPPEALESLVADHNRFVGKGVVHSSAIDKVKLGGNEIDELVDENGDEISKSGQYAIYH